MKIKYNKKINLPDLLGYLLDLDRQFNQEAIYGNYVDYLEAKTLWVRNEWGVQKAKTMTRLEMDNHSQREKESNLPMGSSLETRSITGVEDLHRKMPVNMDTPVEKLMEEKI